MPEHELLFKDNLDSSILEEIRSHHRFGKCPLCSEQLSGPVCVDGKDILVAFRESTKQYSSCSQCKIVWQLEIFNWTDERGDGMVTGEGHILTLYAFSNCFCRTSLLFASFKHSRRAGIQLESSPDGHSTLATFDRHSRCTPSDA